jgi:DNA gyrase subunit A
MVVADPAATLLTACVNGYGKRTEFGPGDELAGRDAAPLPDDEGLDSTDAVESTPAESVEPEDAEDVSSSNRYRTQRRGGMGVIDIKTTKRNGRVVAISRVDDSDELIMMTSRGKVQRVLVREINVIGRNTQGVRIMSLDEGDTLAAVVRVPSGETSQIGDEPLGDNRSAPTPNLPSELVEDQVGTTPAEDEEENS